MEKWIGTRISYVDSKSNCSIVILPQRNRFKEAILFAWVIAYTIVGGIMFYYLLFGIDTIDNSQLKGDPEEIIKNQKIYLTVFIAFWSYFEYKVVRGFLWLIGGKELIKINKNEIIIKESVYSYGKANRYFTDNINELDIVKHKSFSFGFDYENAFWRKGTNSLIFDYSTKSIGFAKKVNEKDANLLMRLIKDRVKKINKS